MFSFFCILIDHTKSGLTPEQEEKLANSCIFGYSSMEIFSKWEQLPIKCPEITMKVPNPRYNPSIFAWNGSELNLIWWPTTGKPAVVKQSEALSAAMKGSLELPPLSPECGFLCSLELAVCLWIHEKFASACIVHSPEYIWIALLKHVVSNHDSVFLGWTDRIKWRITFWWPTLDPELWLPGCSNKQSQHVTTQT